jgi:hypothetical protein
MTQQQILNTIAFLQRVQLNGSEAPVLVEILAALKAMAESEGSGPSQNVP